MGHEHHKEKMEKKCQKVFNLSHDQLVIIYSALNSWISGEKTMEEAEHIVFAFF